MLSKNTLSLSAVLGVVVLATGIAPVFAMKVSGTAVVAEIAAIRYDM